MDRKSQADGRLPADPTAAMHPGAAPDDKAACVGHPAFDAIHGKPGTHAVETHQDFFARPEDRPKGPAPADVPKEPAQSKPSRTDALDSDGSVYA